jgi:hypothetical protein
LNDWLAQVEAEPFIPVKRAATQLPGLGSGDYVVEVGVETWPETQEVGKALADRWRKWGNLWIEPTLLSTLLPIHIKVNPEGKSCE